MTNEKLNQIIAHKNEQLEQQAVSTAREIIDSIAECQESIKEAETRMVKLREALKALEIQQINPISILGS